MVTESQQDLKNQMEKDASIQLMNAIAFIEGSLKSYEYYSGKFLDETNKRIRKGIEQNMDVIKKSLDYYKDLKKEFDKNGFL